MVLMLMMIVRNKDNCILNHTAPVPWPSPLTRVVSLDSLSPVLSLTDVCGSWQTPLSWSHHLSPHWTSLWARDSAQSSRARVTSSYSHCELSLPSAGDQISGLDHFVDGSEFRTRDLSNFFPTVNFNSEPQQQSLWGHLLCDQETPCHGLRPNLKYSNVVKAITESRVKGIKS